MADVFISYKRRFRPHVELIAGALRKLDVAVWFDNDLQAGENFQRAIQKELATASCIFVCWWNDCFDADDSGYVTGEAEIGRSRKALVSTMLEPTTFFPPFNMVHAIDLSKWATGETLGPRNDRNWIAALAAVGAKIGRPGLGDYVEATESGSPKKTRAWAAKNPKDPLCTPDFLAKLETLGDEGPEVERNLHQGGGAVGPGPRTKRDRRRTTLMLAGLGALVLAVGLGIAYVATNGFQSAPVVKPGMKAPPTRAAVEACFTPQNWEEAIYCYTVASDLYASDKSSSNAVDALAILAQVIEYPHDRTTDAWVLRATINAEQGFEKKACELLNIASRDPALDQRKIADAIKKLGC